jgi:hypothetical protein
MKIAVDEFLGQPVSQVLATDPVKNWLVEREVVDDLPKRLIHYIFAEHKVALRCDGREIVKVAFVENESDVTVGVCGTFLHFSMKRAEVAAALGVPNASGPPVNDEILGQYGAWDVFRMPSCRVHVEYELAADRIRRITLSHEASSHQ